MKHFPWIIVFCALFIGISFNALLRVNGAPGLNVFIAQTLLLGTVALLATRFKIELTRQAWVTGIFALLFSLTFAIWTSGIGLALSAIGLFGSNTLFILSIFGHHGRFHHPFHYMLDTATHIFTPIMKGPVALQHVRIPFLSPKYASVIRGILISIPVLLVFALLFLSSDIILQEQTRTLTNNIVDLFEDTNIVSHLVIISLITLAFIGIFGASFWKRKEFKLLETLKQRHETESLIVLGASNLLFLAFILFQAFYLFGGQTAFDNIEHVTYSEYAVQGFHELAVASGLVILLILTLRYLHSETLDNKKIQYAEIILATQTFVLLLSAWIRLDLYVEQYGFTPSRLFGFWFFLTTAIILKLLAVHIYKKSPQYAFMQQSLITISVAMLVFTALAPDAFSVRLNVARAERTDAKVDTFPLFHRLSPEAYPMMSYVFEKQLYDEEEDQRVIESWKTRWEAKRCDVVNNEGNKPIAKAEIFYKENLTFWNWNFSRSKLPACTREPQSQK